MQVTNKLDADLFNYIYCVIISGYSMGRFLLRRICVLYCNVMPILPLLLASLLPGHD